VVSICAAVYFFKIQENEDYQNQLHFRELNTAAHSVRGSIQQFTQLGKTITTILSAKTEPNDRLRNEGRLSNIVNRAKNTPALARLETISDTTIVNVEQQKDENKIDFPPENHIGVFTTSDHRAVYLGPSINTDQASRHAVRVPTEDLLPAKLLSFPIVLLADGSGELVAKKIYLDNSTYAADLEFHSVQRLLQELSIKQTEIVDTKTLPSYSGTLDKKIAGISYRIFVQPITLSLRNNNTVTYYLLGMVPLTEMQLAKLSVSPAVGLWIFIILLMLSALIPILKIRFTSARSHFSKTEISLFFAGCILLLGMLTITVNHQLFYSYLVDIKKSQAGLYLEQIEQEFEKEITALDNLKTTSNEIIKKTAERFACYYGEQKSETQACASMQTNAIGNNTSVDSINGADSEKKENTELDPRRDLFLVNANSLRNMEEGEKIWSLNKIEPSLTYTYDHYLADDYQHSIGENFAENAFKLSHKGVIALSEDLAKDRNPVRLPILRISKSAYNSSDFPFSHRDYFNHSITCQLWFEKSLGSDETEGCKNGVYIQRIKNVSDARLSTQFAYADYETLEDTPINERKVISLSVKFNTFFERILPQGFGYAVFDDGGQVLFHSDGSRSLLENILVETNNDKHIRTLIDKSDHADSHIVSFNAIYRNAEHLFVAGELSAKVPWHIVVFFNIDDLSEYNLWLLLVAVVLFVQLMLVLLLWNRYVSNQLLWSHILSFSVLKGENERKQKGSSANYQMFYGATASLIFSFSVCLLLMLGVVVDLALRLSFWGFLGAIILFLMCKKVNVLPSRAVFWSHPFASFLLVGVGFGVVAIFNDSHENLDWGDISKYLAWAGLLVLGIGIVIYALKHSNRLHIKWRQTLLYSSYKRLVQRPLFQPSSEHSRYSRSYVAYLLSLLWFFAVVPAAMLINSSNHYFLGFQAHLESEHIEQRVSEYEKNRLDYLRLMRPDIKHNVDLVPAKILEFLLLPQIYETRPPENYTPLQIEKNNTEKRDGDKKETIEEKENTDKQEMTVDLIINTLMSMQAFGASINQELFQFAQLDSKLSLLTFNGNKFLQQAVQENWMIVLLAMIATFAFMYKFTRVFIVRRVMGEHIPDNFRLPSCSEKPEWLTRLTELIGRSRPVKVQVLRTNVLLAVERIKEATGLPVYDDQVIEIVEGIERRGQGFVLINKLSMQNSHSRATSVVSSQPKIILVLKGLENLAFQSDRRKQAQCLLQELDRLQHVHIVLLCEVSPLFRLINQHAYPNVSASEYSDMDESLMWSTIIADYTKVYDWTPPVKSRLEINVTAMDVLEYENKGWFQLLKVKDLFLNMYASKLEEIASNWKHDQIVEFFCSHAGGIYRQKWSQCTLDERILLFQLSGGATLNPNSIETLEQLLRRGYIYRDCGWFVVNESFRRFVLQAETDETFADWLSEVSVSSWQYVRIPILVTVVVLAIMIVVTTGQSLQSIIAAATASLGLLPSLMRGLSFFKSAAGVTHE
jgi:hypothetical protein